MANRFDPVPLDRQRIRTPNGFIIRRYQSAIDDDGQMTKTYTDIVAQGVVVPAGGGPGMVRTPVEERQKSTIDIFSRTMISLGDPANAQPADDILWHGQIYQVVAQDDWSDFGFNTARAELQDPTGGTI